MRQWILLFAALLATHAQAWDFSYRETPAGRADFLPTHLAAHTASGFWAFGALNGQPSYARFGADLQLQTVRYGPGYALLENTPDGGVITAGTDANSALGCNVRRLGAAGDLLWQTQMESCSALVVERNGSIWLLTSASGADALVRLDISGVVRARSSALALGLARIDQVQAKRNGDGIFVAGSTLAPLGEVEKAGVRALDASARVQWRWSLDDRFASRARQLSMSSDGTLYVAGTRENTAAGSAFIAAMGANGAPQWQYFDPALEANATLALATDADSAAYLLSRSGTAGAERLSLSRVRSDGSAAWRLPLPGVDTCVPIAQRPCALRVAADGAAVVLAGQAQPATLPHVRLLRVARSASILSNADAGALQAHGLTLLPDGSALLSFSRTRFEENLALRVEGGLLRFDAAGASANAPRTAAIASADEILLDQALAADGSSLLFTTNRANASYALSRVAGDGVRIWRREYPGEWPQSVALALGAERVCIAGVRAAVLAGPADQRVECFAVSDGQRVWSHVLDPWIFDQESTVRLKVLSDGKVVVRYSPGLHMGYYSHHALLSAQGARLHAGLQVPGVQGGAGFDASGNSVGVSDDEPQRLVKLDRDGAELFNVASPTGSSPEGAQIHLGEDGALLMIGPLFANGNLRSQAWYYDAQGELRWSRQLGETSELRGALAFDPDALYVALRDARVSATDTQLLKLSRSQGALLWQHRLNAEGPISVVHDAKPEGMLVLGSGSADVIRVRTFERNTGALRSDSAHACGLGACELRALQVDTAGDLRVVTSGLEPTSGQRVQVHSQRQISLPRRAARLDQPGISGAFYPPYLNGQGFSFAYIASARILFIPWFTYTQGGGNDPAGLRWYVLQASVPAGASTLDMSIFENTGGRFAAPPVTTARAVGTAQLQMDNCDGGTLSYQFNASTNNAAHGTIALARLTPATTNCLFDDGSSTLRASAPPNAGFDERQSGAWFEPRTSGQGLNFHVIPASASNAGLFFATWFSYDPEGAADDASQQHWFTLQAQLANARGGVAELAIFRTIGGSLQLQPTANSTRVGVAKLHMQSCDRASLEYRFDDFELASPMRALSGVLALEKLGGCE